MVNEREKITNARYYETNKEVLKKLIRINIMK